MSMDSSYSEVAILSRLIHNETRPLTAEAARAFLDLDFPAEDQERMNELSNKAADGTLSNDERREVQSYTRVSQILAVLQAKARHALAKRL